MEKAKDYITSILRLILLIAAILIAINASMKAYDTYRITSQCKGSLVTTISNYDIQETESGKKIGYPIVYYNINDRDYEYTGKTEVGSYPYDKNIEMTLYYNEQNPEMAIFSIEVREAFFNFAASMFLAGILLLVRFIVSLKGFGDNYNAYS